MDEAEANRVQTEWCRAEVQRIHAAGEMYLNGRLLDEWTAIELRTAQRQIAARATDIRTSPSTLAPHDESAIVKFGDHPQSIKNRVLLLLSDNKPRTAKDIALALGSSDEHGHVRTYIRRLSRDGWQIDVIENPGGNLYRLTSSKKDLAANVGRYKRYQALLADAQEHDQDELLQIGTRGDMQAWLSRVRRRGMNIVRITYPDGRISYQWRP